MALSASLRMLTRCKAWANVRLYGALLSVPQAELAVQRFGGPLGLMGCWVMRWWSTRSGKRSRTPNGSCAMARGDSLLHVVNHKTCHRGHVAVMCGEMGWRPPTVDLPVFLRDASAAPPG